MTLLDRSIHSLGRPMLLGFTTLVVLAATFTILEGPGDLDSERRSRRRVDKR